MLEKSISAMLSAMEIYNKPDFKYREETFSVLCINSWELLFKAKILSLSSNKIASLYAMEYRTLKSGEKSKLSRPRTNRSGNPMSISIFEAFRIITEEFGSKIEKAVIDNITALSEIRDNSIHFINNDLMLCLKIQELGSASLQNYANVVKSWHGDILSKYNFYLMPISFFREFDEAPGVMLNPKEKKVLDYIARIERDYDNDEVNSYNLTLRIDIRFQKVRSDSGLPIQYSTDSDATKIIITELDIAEKYPWDYKNLTTRLARRFKNFKQNNNYHAIRKVLEADDRFAYKRYLTPGSTTGTPKVFYNPNILKEFDVHYEKV
ncbi:DUF3644 domain-containing protein [Pseudomonas chlororaphis]|uniref:DUF3644 domain-containing protein n=2 Tax=Pseudomonas chlororaphis TaxID=587753 RepID=A0AAQ0AUS7_9PSED|nr:DUF3644 domain-containing protein [Pseudomonas chlororaphis]QNR50878.1 DUF3644 domain-containing protein [Pseudomonas chlororaphis]